MAALILSCCWLPTGIAAYVIANQYDASGNACNDGTRYRVDLAIFLYVVAGAQLGSIAMNIALACWSCANMNDPYKRDAKLLARAETAVTILYALMIPFLLAWAIVGTFMYASEMSASCRHEPIAQMIAAWSIITLIIYVVVCIPICTDIVCGRCCSKPLFRVDGDQHRQAIENMNLLQRTQTRYRSLLQSQRNVYGSMRNWNQQHNETENSNDSRTQENVV